MEMDCLLTHILESNARNTSSLLENKPDGHIASVLITKSSILSLTKPDCYLLPHDDICVHRFGSAIFVSKFNLLKGFWQVPLKAWAKERSAFVTPDKFLQYKVMRFGVHNDPITF